MGVDDVVSRVVNRMMRRRAAELPKGPTRLVGGPEESTTEAATEPAPAVAEPGGPQDPQEPQEPPA